MYIYAIRDNSIGRIYPPFYASTVDEAKLIIRDQLISSNGIALRSLADHLDVLVIGVINFSTAELDGYGLPNDNSIVFKVSEILEQIPQSLLEPSVDMAMIRDLRSQIKTLTTDLEYYKHLYNTHKHSKKGVILIDDQKML